MAEEASWDQTLEEWVTSEGYCCAAGLAQLEDGAFYAAAPVADEKGWGLIYKDPHEEDITQEDGVSTKKMTVTEAVTLLHVCKNKGTTPPEGLWLGGAKYQITKKDLEYEVGEHKVQLFQCARPKKGVYILVTNTQILCVFYDEEQSQTAGNALKTGSAFAEYLCGIGY
eukprot:TRINITY_DN96963_c0_g1_i1.p2 TRINITY_DN96963_c0_g1~~TRINITY_DN96963_c0_g1_i1.p2  ORF type:complete len:194 (-),score=50.61 TRINITY_DN96963_c0_g1_i1:88-594(-)